MDGEPTIVAQQLERGKGLEPASRTQVIRYWLREELDDADDGPIDSAASPSDRGGDVVRESEALS